MSQLDRAALNVEAEVIKTETTIGANTADRVGQMLVDLADSQSNLIDDPNGQSLYTAAILAADILLLDPELTTGVYWATDEFAEYHPVTAASSLDGTAYWQKVKLNYNAATDTYKISSTADGQTQDVGKEIFFSAKNITVTAVTALNPKVFKAVNALAGNETVKESILADADGIEEGNLIGFNTTEALADGYTKILTFGDLSDTDTLAWAVGTVLYLTTNGDVTDIKPSVNAWPLAVVTKQDALTGKLFVNTIGADREDTAVVPAGIERRWFTGDVTAVNVVDFYDLREVQGVVAEIQQQVVVSDNTKLAYGQDWLSEQVTVQRDIPLTSYNAQLESMMTQAGGSGGNERFYVEVYQADSLGAAIDSGSGLPNGDLGVPPITVLASSVLTMANDVTTFVSLHGIVNATVTILVDQYVRYHVLGEKIGAAGGAKTLTIYGGNSHNSFIDIPQQLDSDDILNNSGVSGNTVTDALNAVVQKTDGLIEDVTHPSLSARTYETLTRAEYDAIVTKDPTQLYFTPKA